MEVDDSYYLTISAKGFKIMKSSGTGNGMFFSAMMNWRLSMNIQLYTFK